MWMKCSVSVLTVASICLVMACGTPTPPAGDCTSDPTFTKCVQPILDKSCGVAGCHKTATESGGFQLAGITAADLVGKDGKGASGATKLVVASKSGESLIYLKLLAPGTAPRTDAIKGAKMPLGGSLPDADIATIKTWIDKGAK